MANDTARAEARRGTRRAALALLAVGLLVASGPGSPAAEAEERIPVERLAGEDRIGTAVAVSRAAFDAAETAVLARADDFADALVAAPLAAQRGGPILLTGSRALPPQTAEELDRLGVEVVLVMGGEEAVEPAVVADLERAGRTVERIAGDSRAATAAAAARALDADASTVYVATGEDFPDALAAGPLAAAGAHPLLLVEQAHVPEATRRVLAELTPGRLVLLGGEAAMNTHVEEFLAASAPTSRLAGRTRFETAAAAFDAGVAAGLDPTDLWLADAGAHPDALVAGPVVGSRRGSLLLVDGSHLAAQDEPYARIRSRGAALGRVTLLGGPAVMTAAADEQLQGIVFGAELPRGGRLLFPRHLMVALYGNARSTAMGALGEQPPEQAAERTKQVAASYGATPRTLLPTFELIATVANRTPGDDGLYRTPAAPEEVQAYLDVARRHGIYLVLDIQPGRSDFLTEVRRYEHFLDEPDVGVALDPEWRMHGDTRPGDEVGTVDAAEVNEVVDYLAEIVRRDRLPQKLLIVHQFQDRMITNRDRIRTPEELSVNFHADGFGSRAAKLSKYESFLAPPPHSMGFKLFYDEDTNIFQPHEVLGLPRPPDFVSYQ